MTPHEMSNGGSDVDDDLLSKVTFKAERATHSLVQK